VFNDLKKNTAKNTVLIVDDNNLTRIGLKTALERRDRFDAVHEAKNGKQALEILKKIKPSLVITKMGLPDISNTELMEQITEINKKTKIIILSCNNNAETAIDAVQYGVRAYFSKNTETEKLANLTEMVADGAIWFDSPVSEKILNILKKGKKKKTAKQADGEDPFNLTDRETDVLRLIMEGHNNAEISAKLCVSVHTAKAHVCSILQKMHVGDRTQAAILALKKKII